MLIALTTLGCEHLQFKGQRNDRPIDVAAEPWPYRPQSIRLHPFTAIKHGDDGSTFVDARVEMLDVDGHLTKGVGTMVFELYDLRGEQPDLVRDRQLQTWTQDLTTLETNRSHYDAEVMRHYTFRLPIDAPPAEETRLRLAAQFTDGYGRRMTTDRVLAVPAPDASPANR